MIPSAQRFLHLHAAHPFAGDPFRLPVGPPHKPDGSQPEGLQRVQVGPLRRGRGAQAMPVSPRLHKSHDDLGFSRQLHAAAPAV